MKVKFKKMTNCKSTKRNKYNTDEFSNKRISEKYKCKVDNILKEKQGDNETENEAWEQLKEIVSGASVEVLGRTKSTFKS